VLGRVTGNEDEINQRLEHIAAEYARDGEAFSVAVGGQGEIFRQVGETVESDLLRAESIAFPITLGLLLVVFGSVVAALLPLAVGALAVLGTFLILQLLTSVTDVSVFALNLTTALGLGLAIDYSLFVVSRFREELAKGLSTTEAVVRTVRTAGKTVAFSGGTVAISLAALLIFPQVFMRSFAYAGIAVVMVALIGSVIVLPALLAVLGSRINSLRVLRRMPPAAAAGRWHRVAMAVMRRPIPVATAVVALLVVLGFPFLGVEFGQADDRVLPSDNSARMVGEDLRDNFAGRESAALAVVARGDGDVAAYAAHLSAVAGVERVDAVGGSFVDGEQVLAAGPAGQRFVGEDGTWLSVVPSVEPISPQGERLVRDLRAVDAPFEEVLVGGPSAELADGRESLFSRVPLAIGLIAGVTFVLLFLMFGSLLVPLKALVLNTLSLTAVFGAMVWVFQDGNLSGVLDFTATGTLDMQMPILMFCMAFGLSMDYEVFLLSRIKEEYDRTGDNTAAVAMGLERTGRIVTAAAALLAIVFVAFATSGVTIIKLVGVGLALAVVMDATLVRATLVPAFMRMAGRANWWAPRPLRLLYQRFGISDAEPPAVGGTPVIDVG
jgi:RND superfamily putative drug exporter